MRFHQSLHKKQLNKQVCTETVSDSTMDQSREKRILQVRTNRHQILGQLKHFFVMCCTLAPADWDDAGTQLERDKVPRQDDRHQIHWDIDLTCAPRQAPMNPPRLTQQPPALKVALTAATHSEWVITAWMAAWRAGGITAKYISHRALPVWSIIQHQRHHRVPNRSYRSHLSHS